MAVAFTVLGPDPTSKVSRLRSQACLNSWYIFIHIFMISHIVALQAFSPGQLRLVNTYTFAFLELHTTGFSCLSTKHLMALYTATRTSCLAFSCHYGITHLSYVLCCIRWPCTDAPGHLKWHHISIRR